MSTKLKPIVSKAFYDLMDMCKEVDDVLGFDQRDCGKYFHPDTGGFDDWHKKRNLPNTDPEGKHKNSSQIWYSLYRDDVDTGKWKETPYLDFWHWQLDNTLPHNIRNDSYSRINVCLQDDAPDWVKHIQNVWNDLYKDIADNFGDVDVWVSW